MIPIQKSSLSKISQNPQFHSKVSQKIVEISFQFNWSPTQAVILTNPHVLSIIKQFRNNIKKKNLQEYGNLALKQPMRYEELKLVYEGTWKNNIPEGYGIFYYDSGIFYEGYIKKGKLDGYGLLIMDNQEYYYGNFQNNKLMGKVIFKGHDYEVRGVFVEDQLIQGIIQYKQGTIITMKSIDTGIIKKSNNITYQGSIVNGQACGKGKLTFNNGDVHEGDFLNGKSDGFGIYTYKKGGFVFKGNYRNGKRQGLGKFYHTKDLVEQSNWQQGDSQGNKKIYYKNKQIYSGTNQAQIDQILQQYSLI